MMVKVFYLENGRTYIATGKLLNEDDDFVTIEDRFDGKVRIGKKFIIKMKDMIDGEPKRDL